MARKAEAFQSELSDMREQLEQEQRSAATAQKNARKLKVELENERRSGGKRRFNCFDA